MKELEKTLTELGIAKKTQDIYLSVLRLKKATARQIGEQAGVPRPSVYDHLKTLLRLGLVVEFEIENKKYFQANDLTHLSQLLDEKIERLTAERTHVRELLPKLISSGSGVEAKIKFFEGTDGFRRVLNDILWQDEEEILVMWPYTEMTELAGEEYLENWTRRRVAQGIHIRSIWPNDRSVAINKNKIPDEETRLAPKGVDWNMGYVICGEKVYFISSRKETFAFVVHSHDFAELQRTQFELAWRQGK